MFRKPFLLVLLIMLVLLLSGTTTVLANWNHERFAGMSGNLTAGQQDPSMDEGSEESVLAQPGEWAETAATQMDADGDDGPPPWFNDMNAYEDWIDSGQEGPPPWAPAHGRRDQARSMRGNRDDNENGNDGPPPWFSDMDAYEDWIDSGQEGPPPWAPAHGRRDQARSMRGNRAD